MDMARRKMLNAIKIAAGNSTMSNGLRAIRRFERINKIDFNPYNKSHISTVINCGEHEWFFRKVRTIFDAHPPTRHCDCKKCALSFE